MNFIIVISITIVFMIEPGGLCKESGRADAHKFFLGGYFQESRDVDDNALPAECYCFYENGDWDPPLDPDALDSNVDIVEQDMQCGRACSSIYQVGALYAQGDELKCRCYSKMDDYYKLEYKSVFLRQQFLMAVQKDKFLTIE